jgi:hypothetical protein
MMEVREAVQRLVAFSVGTSIEQEAAQVVLAHLKVQELALATIPNLTEQLEKAIV